MLYKKYRLFDEGVEIMIPSHFKEAEAYASAQHNWMSDDKKVVINVTLGGGLEDEGFSLKVDEYYRRFSNTIKDFDCLRIEKKKILGKVFGEIRYLSNVTGYGFYNIFMLGNYSGRELILTMQCMQEDFKTNERFFDNIAESIRIRRNSQKQGEN